MDVVENSVCSTVEDNEKIKNTNTDREEIVQTSGGSNVCQKTNGVAETDESAVDCSVPAEVLEIAVINPDIEVQCENNQDEVIPEPSNSESVVNDTSASDIIPCECDPAPVVAAAIPTDTDSNENNVEKSLSEVLDQEVESTVELESVVDIGSDRVAFETEILVEENVNDSNESKIDEIVKLRQGTPDLLNELDQNIEFSEALRSTDITGNGVNNNTTPVEEVYNKKELLDILKGNDAEECKPVITRVSVDKLTETEKALQQLSRLKKQKKTKSNVKVSIRCKSERKEIVAKKEPEVKKEYSIVKALVKDWDDEEPPEGEQLNQIIKENQSLDVEPQDIVVIEEEETKQNQTVLRTSVDSAEETTNLNPSKSGDENSAQPQRRLSRIIKKKVIFDPDNPDTFTKVKSLSKNKELSADKDQIVVKKPKMDIVYSRPKSKSPVSKMQWKKPSSKNSKQCKRLSEVDKLLMDEGAVNMIYQLTPEAPKGKKNMKTKAEFIKKIQSTTPDSKEMKFRERKKELKGEVGEAKKILGGKYRSSIGSSVKSPSMNEDFEAHSADDSIIYRRHSSSSYSSSCMSPRRLSDVEGSVIQVTTSHSMLQHTETETQPNNDAESKNSVSEPFLEDQNVIPKQINKDDCLSIKEKLNTKLSLALNKRKREIVKTEKPSKQRKTIKSQEKVINREIVHSFKYVSVQIDQRFGEICILDSGTNFNIEVIKEIEKALLFLDSREDISVTLLLSTSGQMCLNLDLNLLLTKSLDDRTNDAHEIAETIRSLLCTILNHTKLLCTAVERGCTGLGFTLVALSDITFASEFATFALSTNSEKNAEYSLTPGIAILSYLLPQPLLNNIVLFGRQLSATAAVQSGLISHCLWPASFIEQLRVVIKDIAAQPAQDVLLKKQLLTLKKTESMDSIKSSLEKEKDMFVKYWTTVERNDESH